MLVAAADSYLNWETLRQLEQWWNDALRYGGVLLASCMSYSFIAQDLVNSLL